MPQDSPWTEGPDGRIARLRELWAEGHSTAEIGRRLCVGKNSVVSKAHRLDLPGRPSPIGTANGGDQPRPGRPRTKRAKGPTLDPLVSIATPPPQEPLRVAPKPIIVAPKPKPVALPIPLAGRIGQCCWATETSPRRWKYCEDPTVPGRSYCLAHIEGLYVRVHDRREDHAAAPGD